MSYGIDQQDDNNNYFGPQVPHAWDTGISDDQFYGDGNEEAFESNVEGFAELRGLKYTRHDDGLHRLYFAWLKATQPHHEDLDIIGERKLTEAEAQEMAAEAEIESQQWAESVAAYEGAGTYMGRG